jgi:hypothetical protein
MVPEGGTNDSVLGALRGFGSFNGTLAKSAVQQEEAIDIQSSR